jgi:hypothetical protein
MLIGSGACAQPNSDAECIRPDGRLFAITAASSNAVEYAPTLQERHTSCRVLAARVYNDLAFIVSLRRHGTVQLLQISPTSHAETCCPRIPITLYEALQGCNTQPSGHSCRRARAAIGSISCACKVPDAQGRSGRSRSGVDALGGVNCHRLDQALIQELPDRCPCKRTIDLHSRQRL